jgi:uncharacterized protein
VVINPVEIVKKFYAPDSKAYGLLIAHGQAVCQKAVMIAGRMADVAPDIAFVKESAMLHDIGIFMTYAPELGCFGKHPYICHGYLGSLLLKDLGLPRHARVCETHVGVGLRRREILKNQFPLPARDMLPETMEEQIVCYADKFFSKNNDPATKEKAIEKITQELETMGPDKVKTFLEWMEQFGC